MGARQSKRSVDISNPPKKELENGVEEGGKLERLEEGDVSVVKATQNGNAPHAEKEASSPVTEEAAPVVNGETEKEKAETKEEEKEKSEEKAEESLANGAPESPEVTSPEKSTDEAATPNTEEKKKKKKKEKSKLKWSIRSISFSKKDKTKPNISKDESKNGNVTKEEPVAEVVEAEAAANTEAVPVKDEEPKKEEAVERTEEEKKEEKPETSTEAKSAEPEPVTTPAVAPAPAAEEPAPAPAPTPAPEPVVEAPVPVPEPTPEPVAAAEPVAPVAEPEVAVVEPEVEVKTEAKSEELPPPLPASPPPTEAPPPTPVAPTPAPVETLTTEQETEVVGGGGESMAEPEEVEPVLDTEDKTEDLPAPPLINGFNHDDNHPIDELVEKVSEMNVTENIKSIVTDSIISSQENAEDQSEQTASAAE